MSVTIIVPVLKRPQNVKPLVKSINENTKDCQILFVMSPEYKALYLDTLIEVFDETDNVEFMTLSVRCDYGDYARKINFGLRNSCTDWVFTGADDLKFHSDWFDNAMKIADDNIHVIGTQDLGNSRVLLGKHSTHSLIRAEYARKIGLTAEHEGGLIYSPAYPHEYMDDELVGIAKNRGIWKFSFDSVVEHMHPNWGKASEDDSYAQQGTRMVIGKNVMYTRRNRWT